MPNQELCRQAKQSILLFSSKPSSLAQSAPLYAELHQFKAEINEFFQPYHIHRRNALAYRAVFLSIGLLFFTLMMMTGFQSTNWFCGLYFTNCFFAKVSLMSACGILAVAALWLGFYMKAEREAMVHLLTRVKRKIQTIYAHHCAKLGWMRFFRFFEGCSQAAGVRRAYHDAIEKIHDIQESTYQTLRHITQAREIDREKRERLINQALHEMRDRLNRVSDTFDEVVTH